APPGEFPIQRALDEAGLSPGPAVTQVEPDEWMKRLGSLPLAHQPREKGMYHTRSHALRVRTGRATRRPPPALPAGHTLGPLGRPDPGFPAPAATLHRLAAAYQPDPQTGAPVLTDDPRQSQWGHPAAFPSAGGGLVSTADDLLAFCTMM